MQLKNSSLTISLLIALAITLVFAGGYIAAQYVALAHPPGFEILTDFTDEIPLIRLTNFEGQILTGTYEGDQPRFLLGAEEAIVVPEADGSFRLDLSQIR